MTNNSSNLDKWLVLAEPVIGNSTGVATNLHRFKASFGANPRVVERLWNTIRGLSTFEDNPIFSYQLLYGLYFIRLYAYEHTAAGTWSISEKTYRKWAHIAVHLIASCKHKVVSFSLLDFSFFLGFSLIYPDLLLYFFFDTTTRSSGRIENWDSLPTSSK